MFDLPDLIRTIGYLGLFAIVFAETGLLFGFILPGDSLLFTAGILASQHYLNIWQTIGVLFIATLLGDNTGYLIGKRLGPRIFKQEESLFFRKSHLEKAQAFFKKHGPKTIIIARFVPIVRTFTPTLAGVGTMPYPLFLTFSIFGAILWAGGITALGYFLGQSVPNIELYIIPGIILIVLASLSPYIYKLIRSPELRRTILVEIKKVFKKA